MWNAIQKYFKEYPAQEKVAMLLLKHGFCVKKGKIFCENIELPAVRIAQALSIDRRAVYATVKTVSKHPELKKVFENLHSTVNLKDVAPKMNWSLVEFIVKDASKPGILSDVSTIIAANDISIRQAISEDPELSEEPRLYVICEGRLPVSVIENLKNIDGVKSVVLY